MARVAGFSLAAAADVRMDFTQATGSAHVVSLFHAGVGQDCDQNRVHCLNVGEKATATTTYAALDPGSYWLVVQSYPGTTGSTTVTLSTGTTDVSELCGNGIDGDKDGQQGDNGKSEEGKMQALDSAQVRRVAAPSGAG